MAVLPHAPVCLLSRLSTSCLQVLACSSVSSACLAAATAFAAASAATCPTAATAAPATATCCPTCASGRTARAWRSVARARGSERRARRCCSCWRSWSSCSLQWCGPVSLSQCRFSTACEELWYSQSIYYLTKFGKASSVGVEDGFLRPGYSANIKPFQRFFVRACDDSSSSFSQAGVFYSFFVATVVVQRVWQKHYHVLAKRMLAKVSREDGKPSPTFSDGFS